VEGCGKCDEVAEGSGRFARMAPVRLMNCDWRHRRLDEVPRARLACPCSLYRDARLHGRCLYAGVELAAWSSPACCIVMRRREAYPQQALTD
jgi:hypothetical protein